MHSYIVPVTKLTPGSPHAADGTYLWPGNFAMKTGKAKLLNFPGNSASNANFIDGSFYNDGNADYLIVKKNGLTNQIFKTTNIDSNKWTSVNGKVAYGYEGASITKANGKYYLFGDKVPQSGTSSPAGVFSMSSSSIAKWGGMTKPVFMTQNGSALPSRHGTVITLKAGSAEWKLVKGMLDKVQASQKGAMFRLYNPVSGEHLYTQDTNERRVLVGSRGWKYEGIAWYTPTTGDPVYRLYNPRSGEHHYTRDANERDVLVKRYRWNYEGIGWYSDKSRGVALTRLYNSKQKAIASHHYTADANEVKVLRSKYGWKYEGIAWYGVKRTILNK